MLLQRQGLHDADSAALLRPDFGTLIRMVISRPIDDLEQVAFDGFRPLQDALPEVENAKGLHGRSTFVTGRCASIRLG